MAILLPATQDPEEMVKVGGKPVDGWYHLQLESAEEAEDQSRINLKFVVVSPGEECGKHIYETLWLNGREGDDSGESQQQAWAKVYTYCFAMGMLTRDQYDEARRNGMSCEIDFPANVGAQCVGEFKSRTYTNKKKEKVTVQELHKRVYHLTSKEADNAALDPEIAALAGVVVTAKPAPAKRGRKPKDQAAPAATATQPSQNGTVAAPAPQTQPAPAGAPQSAPTPAPAQTLAPTAYDDI